MTRLASIFFILTLSVLPWRTAFAQETIAAEEIMEHMRELSQRVHSFSADVALTLDVDFINMPQKFAHLQFKAPDKLDFDSDDFIVIPKRGLDFTYDQIFDAPYSAILLDPESIEGHDCYVVQVIPKGRSKLAIATLHIDANSFQTRKAEFVTRKDGTFLVEMKYDQDEYNLPSKLTTKFEMEKFKLPVRYLGKNASIDRTKLKENELKEGEMLIEFSNYQINNSN